MSQYLPYTGSGAKIRKDLIAEGSDLPGRNHIDTKDLMFILAVEVAENLKGRHEKTQNNERTQVNVSLNLAEMAHYGLSHKVVCIDTESATALINQKNDVQVREISFETPFFEICVQDNMKVTGTDKQLPSFLVALPGETSARAIIGMYAHVMDKIFKVSQSKEPEIRAQIKQFYDARDGKTDISKIGISQEFLDRIFILYSFEGIWYFINFSTKVNTGKNVEEIIPSLDIVEDATRSKEQVQCQIDMVRLLFNFLIFNQANKDLIKPYKLHNRPTLSHIKPQVSILEKLGFHIRSSHYRTLRDECYYRNMQYPPNIWRIVQVKESLIKTQAQPACPDRNVIRTIEKES